MYTVIYNGKEKTYDVVRTTNSLIKTVISSHETFHDAIEACVVVEREGSIVYNFEG